LKGPVGISATKIPKSLLLEFRIMGQLNKNCEAVCEIKWPLQITANLLSAEYVDLSIN